MPQPVMLLSHRVLVGAPRANSTLGLHDIPSTGAMYKCSLDLGKCEEVLIDTSGGLPRLTSDI